MLCVLIFILRDWRDLQNFLETFLRQVYLLSEFLPEIWCEEISEEISFFIFHFDACIPKPGFTSNKPTYYLLDHGDL